MTYFNGNPYAEQVTSWAHDDCLPDDQFETIDLGPNVSSHRRQIHPWHWAPVWGKAKPCQYCGEDVE